MAAFDGGFSELECDAEGITIRGPECNGHLRMEDIENRYLTNPRYLSSCVERVMSRSYLVVPVLNLRFYDTQLMIGGVPIGISAALVLVVIWFRVRSRRART